MTSNPPPPFELTVILPVYNEEKCIREVLSEIDANVLGRIPRSQLLVVDDGSVDESPSILDEIARGAPSILVIHKTNGGHGDALRCGLDQATGDYVFLLDSDGQIPLEAFPEFWDQRAPDAFLCGVRRKRQDPGHRRLLSRFVRIGIRLLFGCEIRDSNAPFKLFPREFWKRASPLIPRGTLAPSLFLAVLASRDPSMRLIEAAVDHRPRRTGKSTLRPWRLLCFCTKALLQLAQLRRAMREG